MNSFKKDFYGTNPNDAGGQFLKQRGVDPRNPSDVEAEVAPVVDPVADELTKIMAAITELSTQTKPEEFRSMQQAYQLLKDIRDARR
tara:strand:- start:755 stop:1015 length:261 start_codon:yes stop_codon:yes gene_type:complete